MIVELTQADNTKCKLRGGIIGVVIDFPNKTLAVDVIGLKHLQVFENVITAIATLEEGDTDDLAT